jgi:hypothetical protein
VSELAKRYAKVAIENAFGGGGEKWEPDFSAHPDLKRMWEDWKREHNRKPDARISDS